MSDQRQQQELLGDWVWHRDAAAMMGVNEKLLRVKDWNGHYLHWPQLDRIQPVERGRIYLRRSQVETWKQQQEQAAALNKPLELREAGTGGFDHLRDSLAAYPKLLKQLGVHT